MKRLVAILTAFVVTISITSCGGPSPTDVTTTFFDGIKGLDADTIESVCIVDDKDKKDEELSVVDLYEDQQMQEQLKKEPLNKMMDFDYKLSNEQIKDDKATVDVTITTYDLAKPYKNLMEKLIAIALESDEEMTDEEVTNKVMTLFGSEISKLKEKGFEKTATIDLVKVDDQWEISGLEGNKNLMNGLTGGLIDLMEETDSMF